MATGVRGKCETGPNHGHEGKGEVQGGGPPTNGKGEAVTCARVLVQSPPAGIPTTCGDPAQSEGLIQKQSGRKSAPKLGNAGLKPDIRGFDHDQRPLIERVERPVSACSLVSPRGLPLVSPWFPY